MTSFTTRVAGSSVTPPDPTKHVNYSLGMVLGVDDFTQEFAYLAGRDQWTARDLLGYGTAEGLRVTVDYGADRVEVVVTPGAAVSPRGRLIRVTPAQCAGLNDWLAQERNRARLDALLAGGGDSVTLYVVLSYRDCATDRVPIPGEPCRSEEESMAASRLADNFRLELRFDAPDQREEEALRDFIAWLERVEITDEPGSEEFATLDEFEQAVRDALEPSSPPAARPRVRIGDGCEFLRAAFRIWVTELRPAWLGRGQTAAGALPDEEGVLLAELGVPVVEGAGSMWVVDDRAVREVEVREGRRPYLLHLRMVQEWIECGQRVRAPGDSVTPETAFGQAATPGTSEAYSRADHTHGTPPLEGDVTVGEDGRTVVERINGVEVFPNSTTRRPTTNQVLTYSANRWVAANVAMNGDVTGTTADNQLNNIRRVPLEFDRETAEDGQVLTFSVESPDERGDVPRRRPRRDDGPSIKDARWRLSDLHVQGARVVSAREAGAPKAGQVLTVSKGEREGEVFWQAAPPPAGGGGGGGPVTLAGDVEGRSDAARVRGLSGTRLADLSEKDFIPSPGQVLTFILDEGEEVGTWQARDISSSDVSLDGDVTGSSAESHVVGLRGTEIADFKEDRFRPRAGQVLTFVRSVGDRRGNWQAVSPPAPGGDLTGTIEQIRVTGVLGVPIRAEGPDSFNEGDVLTFRGGEWVPEPTGRGVTTTDLGGDAVGPAPSNRVVGLSGFPIRGREDADPPFEDGDVLTFSDKAWVPGAGGESKAGSFVEHPAELPRYSIVAAGIVRDDGESRGPTYNNLNMRVVAPGTVTIGFAGYRAPDETLQYIVKALPVFNEELKDLTNLAVMFDRFLATADLGFRLRVTNAGEFVDTERLKLLELMVEVSQYETSREVAPKG